MLIDLLKNFRLNQQRLRQTKSLARTAGINFEPPNLLIERRSCDTVVLLGSGESINRITEAQWRWIEKQDSFGLNFWPIHSFVPSFLLFEVPATAEREREMFDLFRQKADSYKNSLLITHTLAPNGTDLLRSFAEMFPKIVVTHFHKVSDRRIKFEVFAQRFRFFCELNRRGIFTAPTVVGGSLFRLLSLSHFMGYDRIVLVGFDLNGSSYFWEEYSEVSTGQTGGVHRTMLVDNEFKFSSEQAVSFAAKELFDRDLQRIWLLHKDTLLHPRFPYLELALE